jgi:fatty-acyl-CoA synthase
MSRPEQALREHPTSKQLSLVKGPLNPPLLNLTIGQAFDAAAERWESHEALICPAQSVRLSWGELHRRSEAIAAGLIAMGLRPGERIGIWSLNRWEWTVTQFAAAKAGLILVTVNPAYRLSELEFALNKSGCAALVISPAFKTSDYASMVLALAPELQTCAPGALNACRIPSLRLLIQMAEKTLSGAMAFEEVTSAATEEARGRLRAIEASVSCHDAVNVQFTSGTTGSPKGVTLSHHNILNNGYLVGRTLNLCPEDRICIPVPLYHCFGMVMGNLASLTCGAAMVYPGEGFDAGATLDVAARERCTALYGVPTMFIAELDHPRFDAFDLSKLRTGIMAGSPCPEAIMRKVIDRMHMSEVTICYGMTETSPVSLQTAPSDPLEVRVSTVGRVQPHVEVKIIDGLGEVVERGAPGELCTRGYSVMQGYWDEPDQTAETIDTEGWLHTGDLATLDERGYGRIVGRIKDMVIRGGENLYPREIEEYLFRHPAIRDVQVFGIPDAHYGEALCAWIVCHSEAVLGLDDIRAFCSGQIAHQKIPQHIRFVSEFPTTVTGKVQKFLMRDAMIRELSGDPL